MRLLSMILLLLATSAATFSTSILHSLEQKVERCVLILKISVSEATPPQTSSPLDPAICKAKVLEILKGPADLKQIEFRIHAHGSAARDKLPGLVDKEYIVFLHEPPLYDRPAKERWVLEGPRGLRPIADEYQEYEFTPDRKVNNLKFSHADYLAKIRALASQVKSK